MAGLRAGIVIGAVEAAIDRHRKNSRPRRIRGIFAIVGFTCGIIAGASFAYPVIETALFWRSAEPVILVPFPVHSVRLARSTPVLSIGSEGANDSITISKRDYDVLIAAVPLRRPWRYCIALRRQATYDAVRIWRPTARRFGPQTVFPCPRYAQWW